ncbi:MAG: hypothetical protein Q7S12_02615 [bacterium]|nr:hypothetical protein [bacterium]
MEKMHENLFKVKPSKEEIEAVKIGFEKMAQRLDTLWKKDVRTPEEDKEVELILHNAATIDEKLEEAEDAK